MRTAHGRALWCIMLVFASSALSCGGGGGSAGPAPQTAWYVDPVSGSDSSAGTSTSPWRTLTKVSASTFPSGATIYLMRDRVWYEQLTVPSSDITIDAYGTGALPKIDGSRVITGWTTTVSGLYSSGAVTLGAGEALGNLSENGTMMSFLTWTVDAATTFSGAPSGVYSYEYPSTLYIKTASTPSTSVYRASVKLYGVTATSKSDVTVKNVEVTRFSLVGVHFKDCVRCGISRSVISRGGGATIAPNIYAGNGIEFGNASTNGVVDGVTVSDIFDSGISPQTYANGKAMTNIAIRSSQVGSCGFAGIEVSVLSNGSTTGSSISDVLISNVTITGAGRGWSGRRYGTEGHGIRIIADKGAGTMSNIRLDTTTVSGSVGDGVKIGGEIGPVSMHRMKLRNNQYGIYVSDPTGTTVKLHLTSSLIHDNRDYGVLYNAPAGAGFELFQNTLSDNIGINMAVFTWSGTAAAKIQNNIFYGSMAMTHLYSAPALTGAVINNNCYNEFGANTFGYGIVSYATVSAFWNATTFEANGRGGNVGLTDPAGGNFILTSASTCTALGNATVGVIDDFRGVAFASPPSSGAYQYP